MVSCDFCAIRKFHFGFYWRSFVCLCVLAVKRWVLNGLELCVKPSCDSLRTYEINLKAKPSISLLITDLSFVILGENRLRAFS